MASVLSSFFARDPRTSFPYDIPSESSTCHYGIFIGESFKKAEPNERATCFWSNDDNSVLKVQAQKLKTLRHPNVLVYLDYLEANDGIYLITEPCEPLERYFKRVKLSTAQKELFVSWGIYQILSCLKFLHNEVKISHNNLKKSIFISSSGDWKLSGFESTASASMSNVDLNDLAIIIFQIFNDFSTVLNSKSVSQIPTQCQKLYKRINSSKHVTAEDLLTEARSSGGYMRNKFVDTLLFFEEFQLKDSTEKQSFFVNLKDNLGMFPDDVAKRKILPKLIHMYEYGDAGSHILVPMFKLGRLLDENEYQYRIVPCLVKLFSSSDRNTRVKLLEKIDEFAPHLRAEVINESIYGNLITGFNDTNPAVRESTVKAMVTIADKLNYHNLNNDLMKYLARLQGSDDQPGIRTNTTICLGKISCYIDASHRPRILISAFTRALKDPFPPARIAGVLALSATQQYYSLKDVASKILPSLSPLTMDPEKQVRDQGFKALKGFLENLEKASENPHIIPELEENVKGRNGLLSGEKMPQWAGWALKAISGKFYKSNVPAQAAQPIVAESRSEVSALTKDPLQNKIEDPVALSDEIADDGWGDLNDDWINFNDNVDIKRTTDMKKQAKTREDTNEVQGSDHDDLYPSPMNLMEISKKSELIANSSKARETSTNDNYSFVDLSIKKDILTKDDTNSSATRLQKVATKTRTTKIGGPMKLGAKKISTNPIDNKSLSNLDR